MAGQTRKLKWSLDDLDLTKPIEPLSRLIDDPEKLIDEVFKIAAKYLPKDIVPSSLKDIPTVELKKLCLEQLKKVERETLLNILTDGSSDLNETGEQIESKPNDTKEPESIASGSGQSRVTKDAEIQVEISTVAGQEKDKDDHSSDKSKKKQIKRSKHESSPPVVEKKIDQTDSIEDPNLDSILDRAALEIRELEIRAQAIRELLKKHEDADNVQINAESLKESRKKQRTDSSHCESTNAPKEVTSKDKQQILPITVHKGTEQKPKATSRLSRNPVSMVEEDEPDDLPSSSSNTHESRQTIKSIAITSSDRERKGIRRKQSSEETNIMMQLDNDSDDSIDRELKGE